VQFGLKYGVKGNERPDFERCAAIMDEAVQNGITAFDTAPLYGEAEEVIGRFLDIRPENRKKIKIVTKLPSGVGNINGSLKALNVSSVDGVLFHDEKDLYKPEAVGALVRLKREGLAANVGVSVYTPETAVTAAKHKEIDYIQIPYNALDRRLEQAGFFEAAREKGKTVFARSLFLQGLLLMDSVPIIGADGYVRLFREICAKYGMDPAQGCVNYAAANGGIDYLIMGVESVTEVVENINTSNIPVNRDFINEIRLRVICGDETVLNPSLWRMKR
jgi:aryl-alcohol dehydrogenase-like predicted oxidoreductase